MFLRLVRATVSKGVKREYVRVVEAYRDASGKTRHHTIINLGRRDLLARHLDLDKLARLLHGDARADRAVRRAGVAAIGAWDWGPVLAVRQLWNELGLDHVVAQGGGRGRGDGVSLSERALVLVANRLASPGSEHALAQWLETDFVCDRHGRRWIAAWRDEAERKASRTPRVRVAGRQLQQWYRTLDQLIECKVQIEHALYLRLRDLFSLQSYADGVFRFFEHPVHFTREQAYEGKYVIQTEEPNLSAVDAVRLYKELSEVERAFANLKDVLDMRPIYHRTDDRVQAHIFVAALAFLLHRAIEKKLKTARLDLSATEALTALKSVRVVDIDLGDGTTKRSVTRGTQRAAAVLRALGITDLDPPIPPQPGPDHRVVLPGRSFRRSCTSVRGAASRRPRWTRPWSTTSWIIAVGSESLSTLPTSFSLG